LLAATLLAAPAIARAGDVPAPIATAATPAQIAAYVRARAADAAGHSDVAARAYAAALDASPDNPVVAVRAYREGLEAGDLALADRAVAILRRLGAEPGDAALQPLAEAARAGDTAAARAAVARFPGTPLAPLAPAFAAWVAWAEGGDAFAPRASVKSDLVARRFAAESRALLLLATRRTADGLAALRALPKADRPDLRVTAAQILAGTGHKREARTLLAGDDPVLVRLARHLDGVKPSLGVGISRLYSSIAAELAGDEPSPLVIALARGALRAEPDNQRARLVLADELSRFGASGRALAVLDEVPADSPFAGVARSSRVSVLASTGDATATLAAAGAVAGAKDASPYDIQRFGDLLLAAHRPDEAAAQYARVAALDPTTSAIWLQYGGALDDAKRWPEARAALRRALTVAPDEPLALNYLGYAQIAHGEDLAASRAMLEKAARLKPDDASITDSLAWAYVQAGEVARALPMLERAWQGEPANGTIAEHLGDAYWRSGRRYEARYAWRAAQALADAGDTARLAYKIAHGTQGAQATP
jgi:tetratricopeptide (TPR) repeat protein